MKLSVMFVSSPKKASTRTEMSHIAAISASGGNQFQSRAGNRGIPLARQEDAESVPSRTTMATNSGRGATERKTCKNEE